MGYAWHTVIMQTKNMVISAGFLLQATKKKDFVLCVSFVLYDAMLSCVKYIKCNISSCVAISLLVLSRNLLH